MKTKRILAMVLAVVMVLAVAMSGCSNAPASSAPASSAPASSAAETSSKEEEVASEVESSEVEAGEDEEFDMDAWTETSSQIYGEIFGEFLDAYDVARAEILDNDKRKALMAIAEAKYLEQGVGMPVMSNGGNYRLTRAVPYTFGYSDWSGEGGNYEDALITTELISAADYQALTDYWNEHLGDGTYRDYAKQYLTDKGYEFKNEWAISYSSDPMTWDPMNTSRAADGTCSTLTWDPLYGWNDEKQNVPFMAESYEVSADGLTYTFKIRQGLKWCDSQGRELGDVTANDWVSGMQHVLDAKAGLETLLAGRIVNAAEYIAGDITDFAEVGVAAADDHTLVYSLTQPIPYFMSMLTYSIFAPLYAPYYESMGGKFGEDFDEGNYGVDADSIAYCGPFLVSNWTKANTITYTKNPFYWDADNSPVETFSFKYNDGSDTTKSYTDVKEGTTDLQTLNTATLEIAKSENVYPDMVHTTLTGPTSYMSWLNVNRYAYANASDSNMAVSKQTAEDKARTMQAVKNIHFRRAMMFGMDRVGYRAQAVGDDLAALQIRNTYTPGNFVALEKEVTVDINGTPTTFPAGTYYGKVVQAQLSADGFPAQVWDDAKNTGDGYDGWYNPEYAMSEMALAVEELAAEGLVIDKDHPIVMDTPNNVSVETFNNAANFLKKNLEASVDGLVEISLVECVDTQAYNYTGYFCDYGYEMNYNLFYGTGWTPDYADPSTFLDTLLPDYEGYMTMLMGLF